MKKITIYLLSEVFDLRTTPAVRGLRPPDYYSADFVRNNLKRTKSARISVLKSGRLWTAGADIYAGGMMYMLGASLAEAQAGIESVVKTGGSATHPPRRARSEAVANGWKRAKERLPVHPPRIQLGGNTGGADRTDNMIFIAGGSFMMGSESGGSDEKPVHPAVRGLRPPDYPCCPRSSTSGLLFCGLCPQ